MEKDIQNITLKICESPIKLTVDRETESYYRQAEDYIKSKWLRLRSKYPKTSNEMIISIVAVELGVELKAAYASMDGVMNSFEKLDKDLTEVLKNKID